MTKLLKLIVCLVVTYTGFSQDLTPIVSTSLENDTLFTFSKKQTQTIVKAIVSGKDCNLLSEAKSDVITWQDSIVDVKQDQINILKHLSDAREAALIHSNNLNRSQRIALGKCQKQGIRIRRQRNILVGIAAGAVAAFLIK